jgi:hypothetical protein
MLKTIKSGDPQPLKCEQCNDFQGYQISDLVRINFITVMDEKGAFNYGFYSDSLTVINEGKTAFCPNCGERLKFKVKR